MKLAEPNVHKSLLFVAILNFFAQKKLKNVFAKKFEITTNSKLL